MIIVYVYVIIHMILLPQPIHVVIHTIITIITIIIIIVIIVIATTNETDNLNAWGLKPVGFYALNSL